MDVYEFWSSILTQNAEKIKLYFEPNACVKWHCTNEQFTVDEFIRANCEYPGEWDGEIEKVVTIGDTVVTALCVYPKDKSSSFHVTSFMQIHNDLIVVRLYDKFVIYEKKHPEEFHYYFKKLCDDWKYYIVDCQPIFPKSSRFPRYNDGLYKEKINYRFIVESDYLDEIQKKKGEVVLEVLEYVLMLQKFLQTIVEYRCTVWWLNCIPSFIYAPILSFKRGRNQEGLFIYQSFLSYDEELYNCHILSMQRIWPDYVIVIENKEQILKELDFIGINEKFIYGDYDSIAKYIRRKYDTST